MEILNERSDQDLALLHLLFAIVAAVMIVTPMPLAYGNRLLILVVFYNVLIPVAAHMRNHKEWMDIWLYSIIVSLFMIFPDWFLAKQLEVISFPVDGTPMIDVIPVYMAGLWAISFFIIIYVGNRVGDWQSGRMQIVIVGAMSLVIYGMAEATLWTISWWAHDVFKIGGVVALYILIPEIILGLAVFVIYPQVAQRHPWYKIHWSFLTMLLYMGCVSFFYFAIERIILPALAG